ncbi:MAG: YfiR family protein [Myxococcales bacterium]|nr:YfiR family protein [Myxococcales bacterium]
MIRLSTGRTCRSLPALLALWASTAALDCLAQGKASREVALKKAFVLHFLSLVDWPEDKLPRESAELVLGMYGFDPLGAALHGLTGKVVRGRRLVVRHFTNLEEVSQCHALFVSPSEQKTLRAVFDALADSSVLTVSDTAGFAEQGGVLNLRSGQNHVRYELNREAARRARLTLGPELLRLARVVR